MRKLLLLILSSAMLVGRRCAAVFGLLFDRAIFFRFVAGAGCLAFAGGYLIWTDFVAPRLGIKA
jgi:hypothetical protein